MVKDCRWRPARVTAANAHDVTQPQPLVDAIPLVRGKVGRASAHQGINAPTTFYSLASPFKCAGGLPSARCTKLISSSWR
jgi:hypothetical protein